jgi:hypothetical protein
MVEEAYNSIVALEHNDTPRFTAEQRDEILNLANRLQGQHEGTVGADELVRVAEEAGIDPRFVHEAAMRLGRKPQPISRAPLIAVCLFAFQAVAYMFVQNPGLYSTRSIAFPELAFAAFTAFALGLWASRERRVRFFVPVASIIVWTVTGLAMSGFTILTVHEAAVWVLPLACVFGLLQSVAALCGVVVAAGFDRKPGRATSPPRSLEL